MIHRDRRETWFLDQRHVVDAGLRRLSAQHRDIGLAPPQRRLGVVRPTDAHEHIGMRSPPLPQERNGETTQSRPREGQPQRLWLHRLGQRGVERCQDPVAVLPQPLARVGQRHVPGRAVDEPHAQTPFQLLQSARESWLRDVQRLRGRGDRSVVADRGQRTQMP
ncbi:hypothetical protein UK23_10095 [Lentzea aerocolonigenes]|uniref:Uncharacterized protein n=1 Tax=Lentzea aerocolonigenes TaxID=68170 RepID=A0A0F0H8F0_LENAE|nr:hypothetical protein UK23_10095 [Lentzea aerocolonigenes]